MLELQSPPPGLLFLSFLYRSDQLTQDQLVEKFENLYGECFSFVPSLNPLETYYKKEMGSPLKRFFLVTKKTYPRDYLLTTKLSMVQEERIFSLDGKRFCNIDVGFLSLENFQLATTKIYSHRIYLSQNIYSDLTYCFSQGTFQELPWTYPDYRDQEKKNFLLDCRQHLLQLLK